jgi:hypothetical protein
MRFSDKKMVVIIKDIADSSTACGNLNFTIDRREIGIDGAWTDDREPPNCLQVGKTQIELEYAYRYNDDYEAIF